MEQRERDDDKDTLTPTGSGSGRALVIEPWIKRPTARTGGVRAAGDTRTPEARLEEAMGLARAIDLDVVQGGIVMLHAIRPPTYVGKGKVDEIAGLTKSLEASVVILDCAISPVQGPKSAPVEVTAQVAVPGAQTPTPSVPAGPV